MEQLYKGDERRLTALIALTQDFNGKMFHTVHVSGYVFKCLCAATLCGFTATDFEYFSDEL